MKGNSRSCRRCADAATAPGIPTTSPAGQASWWRVPFTKLSPPQETKLCGHKLLGTPGNLTGSELFDRYKAGSNLQTQRKTKPGIFSRANGGTVFLDEIGDIIGRHAGPSSFALQEKTVEPLGSTAAVKVDSPYNRLRPQQGSSAKVKKGRVSGQDCVLPRHSNPGYSSFPPARPGAAIFPFARASHYCRGFNTRSRELQLRP